MGGRGSVRAMQTTGSHGGSPSPNHARAFRNTNHERPGLQLPSAAGPQSLSEGGSPATRWVGARSATDGLPGPKKLRTAWRSCGGRLHRFGPVGGIVRWAWVRPVELADNGFGPRAWVRSAGLRDNGFGPRACVTMGSVRGIAPWNWVRSAGLPENGFGPRIAPDWLRFVRRLGGIAQALRNNSCRRSLRERATSRSIPARMSKESWKNKEDSNHEGHKDHKELRIHP